MVTGFGSADDVELLEIVYEVCLGCINLESLWCVIGGQCMAYRIDLYPMEKTDHM